MFGIGHNGGPPLNDDDFVWGAREIGRIVGRTERQARHLIETGRLPVRNHNGILSARVGDLRAACRGEISVSHQEESNSA